MKVNHPLLSTTAYLQIDTDQMKNEKAVLVAPEDDRVLDSPSGGKINSRNCCPSKQVSFLKTKFRQMIPIFILFVYYGVGGVIFWKIEGSNARYIVIS